MGRKKRYHERMVAAFPKGSFEEIDKSLGKKEGRTEFLRTAKDHELELRKKASSPPARRGG